MYPGCDIATEGPAVTLFLKSGFTVTPLNSVSAPTALQRAAT